MQRIDHVYVAGAGVFRVNDPVIIEPRAKAVRKVPVRHHDGAFRNSFRQGHGERAGAFRTSIHRIAKAVAVPVDAALHDGQLFGQALLLPSPVLPVSAGLAHELKMRIAEVSGKVVPDEGAIDVEGAFARWQQLGLHHLANAHAHEPGSVERHAAAQRGLAQGKRIGHAFREGHPNRRLEFRPREQRAGLWRKRLRASFAQPPLLAASAAPLLDEVRASARRALLRA